MQQTSTWSRRFQKLGLIGLLLLAVNFTYQIYHHYIAKPGANSPGRTSCDLRNKPCTVSLSDDRQVTFEIQPRTITQDKKLTFTVQLKNIEPDSVILTLTPVGQVQYAKNLVMQDAGVYRYNVVAQLNEIMSNHEKWLALVRIRKRDQDIAFPFKFESSSA